MPQRCPHIRRRGRGVSLGMDTNKPHNRDTEISASCPPERVVINNGLLLFLGSLPGFAQLRVFQLVWSFTQLAEIPNPFIVCCLNSWASSNHGPERWAAKLGNYSPLLPPPHPLGTGTIVGQHLYPLNMNVEYTHCYISGDRFFRFNLCSSWDRAQCG